MQKNEAYILVGPPGVGKTTYVKNNLKDMVIISSDEYIEEYAKEYNMTYQEAFAEKDMMKYANKHINSRLAYASNNNLPIVWDQTNMSRKKRLSLITKLKNHGYNNITVVEFEFDIDICKQRCKLREPFKVIPDHVLNSMVNNYQPVSWEEPFDDVIRVPL